MRLATGMLVAVVTAALAAAALATGVGGSEGERSAAADKPKRISCKVKLAAQRFPSESTDGVDFGQITCDRPLGFGMQHDKFTMTPTSETTGTAEARFRAFFKHGMVKGTWDLTYAAKGPCDLDFEIVVNFTRGTERFEEIAGSGSGSGDFTDLEAAPDCDNATFEFSVRATGI